jgi:uncharacterized protein
MLDRRWFLRSGAGALGAMLVSSRISEAGQSSRGTPLLASCVRTRSDSYAVAVFEESGTVLALHPLPDRGHDVAFDAARGRCVAFARRPGTFAVVFDVEGRAAPDVISAIPGRHFFGHGVFSADGALLYATENDIATGEGRIGVYEALNGFRRIGEIATGGIGPHELVWCADGRTLAVANGGLDTDPAFGRMNIDVAGMTSSVTILDAADGGLLDRTTAGSGLDLLSIRHLAVDRHGAIWFGCQWEGDPTELPPLVGRMDPGGRIDLIDLPPEIRARPRNYIGSVAMTGDGSVVALSAPRGGVILGFDTASARFVGAVDVDDGCGLAPAEDGLTATTGHGRIERLWSSGSKQAALSIGHSPVAFDNHLLTLA